MGFKWIISHDDVVFGQVMLSPYKMWPVRLCLLLLLFLLLFILLLTLIYLNALFQVNHIFQSRA